MPKQPPKRARVFFPISGISFGINPQFQPISPFTLRKRECFTAKVFFNGQALEWTPIRCLIFTGLALRFRQLLSSEELLKWNGDSSCWPNNIAKLTLKDDKLDTIKVNLFGWPKDPFNPKKGMSRFSVFSPV